MRGGVFEGAGPVFWFAFIPFCVLLAVATLLDVVINGVFAVLRHAREVVRR